MHRDQLTVELRTVRTLLDAQFPQLQGASIEEVHTTGTVNAIFRIGPDLAARFPLTAQDPDDALNWLRAEADASRELAEASTVPTTEPVALGEPGDGYPMPWSIQTWLPGYDATVEDPADSMDFAHDLASLIATLRGVDTRGRRFEGAGRGGHLPDHDEWLERCFRESERLLDVPRMRSMWADLKRLPEPDADAMCHGDLTPPNVLVAEGRLVGVLDGGGFGPADPALDLVAAWHLMEEAQRDTLRTTLGCSDVQWLRGTAWAFQQAMGLVWYYVDSNPSLSRWGLRTLDRIVRAGVA